MANDTIRNYRKEIVLAVLLVFTICFGLVPSWVEGFYSTGLYPYISAFFRIIFGSVPFSAGDLFYGILIIFILYFLFRFFLRIRQRQINRAWWKKSLRSLARLLTTIYLIFQWLWGLNYHRLGSSYQLSIQPGEYSDAELVELVDTLNNNLVKLIPDISYADSAEWYDFGKLAARCELEYNRASVQFPFLSYRHPSVKQMLIGSIGGYGGFSGYLNPFTAEAQINSNMPAFQRPYVACHEIGHQLGYAAEEEANLAGYLVARQSVNPAVRYSVYHDLLTYASRELYALDSNKYKALMTKVPALVKQHAKQARDYYNSFRNPLQPIVDKWYDLYLKANSQEKGLRSYGYITAWLIAYARKYGWDKI